MLDKEMKIHGLSLRLKESGKNREKHHKLFQRYDAFYTSLGMIIDALESTKPYPLTEIEKYIKAVSSHLNDSDLNELRQMFEFIQEDNPDIAIREVLGAKLIKTEEVSK